MLLHYYARHWSGLHEVSVVRTHDYNLLEVWSSGYWQLPEKFELDGITVYNQLVLRLPGNFLVPYPNRWKLDFGSFDVIIGCLPVGLEMAMRYSRKFGIPYFAYLHGTDYRMSGAKAGKLTRKYRMMISRAKGMAFVSAYLRQQCMKMMPRVMDAVILPGAIPGMWTEHVPDRTFEILQNGKMRMVTPAKLVRQKNFECILKGLEIHGDSEIEYTIVGSGSHEDKLRAIVSASPKLKATVNFLPKMSHRSLMEVIDQHEILVLLSTNESFGLVYLEGMARGCLVIGTRGEGIDGVIRHGENGFLCDPEPEAFSRLLTEISQMKVSQLKTIANSARATAREYVYEHQAETFTKWLKQRLNT